MKTTEVTYELHETPLDETGSHHLFPSFHRFAVVKDGRLVVRTRTNGSAYALTYRTRTHAENGVRVARKAMGDDVTLYDREAARS